MAGNAGGLAKRFFRYTLTPSVLPRLHNLTAGGFSNLSSFMATVFNAAGLLPGNHRFLQPGQKGRFGFRDVVGEAHSNIRYSLKHIDQVIIFYAILLGLGLLAIQFTLLMLMAVTGSASATAPGPALTPNAGFLAGLFTIPAAAEQTDLAYRIIKMIFAPSNLFGVAQGDGMINAFHVALQSMYIMYSQAILVVAAVILAYFIFAIVTETAQTGTPFGKRFNHVWAPIRLVAGIGLLIPVAAGFNSGQWIALYAAKFGSNFATNGWVLFNNTMQSTYLGDESRLMAVPNNPEMMHLPAFFMLAHACDYAEERKFDRAVDAYVVVTSSAGGQTSMNLTSSYAQALNFSNNEDIYIRFGHQDVTHTDQKGLVDPVCGEIHLTTNTSEAGTPGYIMQEAYYKLIQAWWFADLRGFSIDTACGGGGGGGVIQRMAFVGLLDVYGASYIRYNVPLPLRNGVPQNFANQPFTTNINQAIAGAIPTITGGQGDVGYPSSEFKQYVNDNIEANVNSCIQEAVRVGRQAASWTVSPNVYTHGWVGAAIEYNKIAGGNGAFAAAVQSVPRPSLYPAVMEHTFLRKLAEDDNILATSRFAPTSEGERPIGFERPDDDKIAEALYKIQEYWEEDGYRSDVDSTHTKATSNRMIDAINAILGTQGVFDMCKNTDVHPLAQLAMVGRTLIESSIRNLGFSVASGAAGGLAYIFSPHAGAFGHAGSGFFQAVAGIGLLLGFILFYIIPFMPFIYFFFGVGGWIKGLFEAMVGIPLWALAHIRIDGEGLPGSAGKDGYFLIFEIFIRPIMMVISLVASILIFSALVKILNDIFFVVVSNLSGFNAENVTACGITNASGLNRINTLEYFRGPIDEFFFTIVYVIIVYMLGMSCFKLIDAIPDNIMRWMGENIDTFNDKADDPAENIVQKISISGGQIGSKLQGASDNVEKFGKSFGRGVHDLGQESSLRGKYE